MKVKLFITVFVIFIIVVNVKLFSQNDYMKDRFTIGVYNWVMKPDFRGNHIQNYRNLNLNANFSFTYRGDYDTNAINLDGYNVNVINYLPTFNSTISDLYTSQPDYFKQKTYFERAKVLRGACGQRSTYQAEYPGTYNSKYPGYGYQSSQTGQNYTENFNGETVTGRKCVVPIDNIGGYIVKDLYENIEQINRLVTDPSKISMKYFWSDKKDDDYFWVVKPRMRIKVEDFNDPYKKELTVVRIDVKRYDGTKISNDEQFTIKVKDFGDYYENYSGEYVENFYIYQTQTTFIPRLKVDADTLTEGVNLQNLNNSQVDYAIYWPGTVDVWLDYVRLDDEWAHYLFTDPSGTALGNRWKFHQKIAEEVNALSTLDGFGYFYVDEYAYNNYPCIAEVNRIIKTINPNTGLVAMNWELSCFCRGGNDELRNQPFNIYYDTLYSSKAVTDILTSESYPFHIHTPLPSHFTIPENLPQNVRDDYEIAMTDEEYNDLVNWALEESLQEAVNSDILNFYELGTYRKAAKLIKTAKTEGKNITFSLSIQNHSFESGYAENGPYGLREPTNQEISLQSYLTLVYGAKQIMDFSYNTESISVGGEVYHDYGLLEEGNEEVRTYNYYGQPKWDFVCNLNFKLRQIGEKMYPTNQPGKHLIYSDSRTINTIFQNEHPDYQYGLPFSFVSDIKSIYPDENWNFPEINFDDVPKRYWEIGTFNPPLNDLSEKFSKYFIMLNKRCTPATETTYGDIRNLKIKFNPNELTGFNNWALIDPLTNSIITVIDKNSNYYYDAGIFQPGEGKLLKLAPVMQEGGTFVCDEEVINQQFVCKGLVNTGGYDLTIKSENSGQTNISFKQNSKIYAEYSELIHIEGASSNNKTIFQGYDTDKWDGIYANNCEQLNISFSEYKNLNGNWTISAYNCEQIYVSSCHFDLGENNSKAINVNNSSVNSYAFIYNNQINVTSPTAAICLIGSGGCEIYSMIEDNVITSTEGSNYGIFLSNNYSHFVSDNYISGFDAGLQILGTDINLCDNTITSNIDDSYGIFASVTSQLKMGYFEGDIFGRNKIENYGNGCNNIKLDNSVFFMDLGQNALDVNTGSSSYNMFGTGEFETSGDGPVEYIEAKENCFNGPGNNAVYSIQHHQSPYTYYSLHELPHYCTFEQDMIADYIFPTYNNLTDTVFKLVNTPELTSDSKILNKNLMRTFLQRNYDSAHYISTVLLNTYYDSIFTPPVIKILYLSSSKLDTADEHVAALKTYLEQLILNHSQNVSLVKSAYYYIQKCKVQLHQYTSALTGFQDIMMQNPYSYEGLMASWDYAATQLLANSGGSYVDNEMNSLQWLKIFNSENQLLNDTSRITKILKTDTYDKNVFSKEERKILIKSVGNILKEEREKQIEKVKNLEDKFERTNEKEKNLIKKELDEAKVLNSVIKTKTPKDDKEYIMIINNDLEKIGRKSSDVEKGNNNSIPVSYELKQNYPNPFNPVTKISFALPKESKVKLIIYDMLGREVAKIINNENLSAGTYIREFNGSNLASGVYFLRMLINDGKDFSDVKKIVLLK